MLLSLCTLTYDFYCGEISIFVGLLKDQYYISHNNEKAGKIEGRALTWRTLAEDYSEGYRDQPSLSRPLYKTQDDEDKQAPRETA
jgi:hypothetical protein